MQYGKRLNAEADVRIQMSSIKPDIKDSSKNVEQSYSSHYIYIYMENTDFFSKQVIFVKMWLVLNKLVCNFYILISNSIYINR